MKAIRTKTLGHCEVVDNLPIPSVADLPGFVLIRTTYVGIHHCDYLFTDLEPVFIPDITLGVELSGVVVDAHPSCTRFRKGDRVAGCTFPTGPAMPNGGTLAEYAVVKGDTLLRLDALGDAVREEQTAGLGIPLLTVFMAFYRMLGLPPPGHAGAADKQAKTILVYGGSTNTGMLAIQYAKLSGLRVLSTCSPHNFDLVRSLGADEVFDYADPARCAEAIRAASPGGEGVRVVFDCVGAFASPQICADAMAAPTGGGEKPSYVSVSMTPCPRDDVASAFVAGEVGLGEPFVLGGQTVPADAAAFEAAVPFVQQAEEYLRDGKIRLPEVEVVEGFEGVLAKMDELRRWKVSARKFVARMG